MSEIHTVSDRTSAMERGVSQGADRLPLLTRWEGKVTLGKGAPERSGGAGQLSVCGRSVCKGPEAGEEIKAASGARLAGGRALGAESSELPLFLSWRPWKVLPEERQGLAWDQGLPLALS